MSNRTLTILDTQIDVEYSDPSLWSEGALGRAYILESKIIINDTLKDDLKLLTLIHEVTHLISNLQGVELDETQVTALSHGFYSFIKNNLEILNEDLHKVLLSSEDLQQA